MLGCPKKKGEIIPPDYVPLDDRLEWVLIELGLAYIAKNKLVNLGKKIEEKTDRDTSQGKNHIHIDDLLNILEKKIIKYT